MSAPSTAVRADGFYKFLTLVGLVIAGISAGLTLWDVRKGQASAFALEAETVSLGAQASRQQTDLGHISAYLNEMKGKVRTARDVGTAHYVFLVDEVSRTEKRAVQGRIALKGTNDLTSTRRYQIGLLNSQGNRGRLMGAIAAGFGVLFCLAGVAGWYWRVQRYLEIESEARMTASLVEEVLTRSRTDVVLARTGDTESKDGIAVVSETRHTAAPVTA